MLAVFSSRKNAKISQEIAARTDTLRIEVNSRLSQLLSAKVGEAEAKGQRDVAESERAAVVSEATARGHAEGVEAERVRGDKTLTLIAILASAAAVLLTSGCSLTRLSTKRNKIDAKSMVNAQQNNKLANDVLERQPFTNRTAHTEVARVATEQNLKILGPPIRELSVDAALHTNATNYEGVRTDVERNLGREFGDQNQTEETRRDLAARLEEQGRLRVEEYKKIVAKRWTIAGWVGGGILVVAGIVAALYFFPPLIMAIVGAFKTAKAASAAMRNTTIGIQKAFEVLPAQHGAKLASILSSEQDKPDKALVDEIKIDALKAGEINTIETPKFPPPSKPPPLSPDPGEGPDDVATDIKRRKVSTKIKR